MASKTSSDVHVHIDMGECVGHKLATSEQKLQNTNPAHIKVCNENIKCNIY